MALSFLSWKPKSSSIILFKYLSQKLYIFKFIRNLFIFKYDSFYSKISFYILKKGQLFTIPDAINDTTS